MQRARLPRGGEAEQPREEARRRTSGVSSERGGYPSPRTHTSSRTPSNPASQRQQPRHWRWWSASARLSPGTTGRAESQREYSRNTVARRDSMATRRDSMAARKDSAVTAARMSTRSLYASCAGGGGGGGGRGGGSDSTSSRWHRSHIVSQSDVESV